MSRLPAVSNDQIAALVELARPGSIRQAATALFITRQGVRNRLLALEKRMGAPLYHKSRGRRTADPLTPEGRRLLPRAIELVSQMGELGDFFFATQEPHAIRVAASQYLILYVLI